MVRRRLLISGHVQGVFFRDSCRQMAREQSVSGSARNLPDGRIEIQLEGYKPAVDRVIAWCRLGPPMAEVEKVEVYEERPTGQEGFTVS
ncbi:MAG TPA: acylphosphatase [Actinomycetota bacterium]|nr:acylphosphatase [Actinomycetota bacterium]